MNGTGSDLRNHPNALAWPIAKHFDVLAYDHRCLGRSQQRDENHQPSMVDFAADALALCDAEGLDEFSLLGISFGGMVAQELAIMAGSRLSKLVLCCTSPGGPGRSSYPLHDLYAQGRTTLDIMEMWDLRAADDPKVAAQLAKFFEGPPRPPEPPPGLLKQLEARSHHDTRDRLASISADTLVAYGLHDGVAPPRNSEFLAEHIPRAERAPFEGGHLFFWQDRSAWPTIQNFLSPQTS